MKTSEAPITPSLLKYRLVLATSRFLGILPDHTVLSKQ